MRVSPFPRVTFRHALTWSFVMMGGRQCLTSLLTFVLAAILGPQAFGTMTIALVYVLFFQLFLDQGLTSAIIQRKELGSDHLDAAFWMLLVGSLLLTGMSLGLSSRWAAINRLPELKDVISLLSLSIPINGLTIVQQAFLQREMNFRTLAIRTNVSALAGGGVGMTLAFLGFGVWSLVAQQLTSASVGLCLLWSLTAWRPRLQFSIRAARDLLRFSTGAFLGLLGVFANNRCDAMVMGMFFGPVAVGIYRVADRIIQLFVELMSRSVQAVAFPACSRVQNDAEQLAHNALRCIHVSSVLGLPALGVVAASSKEVVALLGPIWADAAVPLVLLCFVGMVRTVVLFTGSLMYAVGRPHAMATLTWAHATLGILAFLAVAFLLQQATPAEQASGIAASRVAFAVLVSLPVNWIIARRLFRLPHSGLARAVLPALTAAGTGFATSWALSSNGMLEYLPAAVRCGALLGAGAIGAAIAVLILDTEVRRWILHWSAKKYFGQEEKEE